MIEDINVRLPIGTYCFRGYSHFASWYSHSEKTTKQWYVDHVQTNWNIIDAGANIGMYSVLFAKLAPLGTVYCFEPTDTFDLLQKNIENFGISNAKLERLALSNNKGIKKDRIFKIWGTEGEYQDFPFTTIDDYVSENKLSINMIKIDVDSYDYEVLLGARNTLDSQSPGVFVEVNSGLALRGFSESDVRNFMKELRYELVGIFDTENYLFARPFKA